MIKYNFKYRGPFEYDKFLISILQFSNEVKNMREAIVNGELNLLNENNSKIKSLFDRLTLEEGIMNDLLYISMLFDQEGGSDQ